MPSLERHALLEVLSESEVDRQANQNTYRLTHGGSMNWMEWATLIGGAIFFATIAAVFWKAGRP